jgi:hypothetical protein
MSIAGEFGAGTPGGTAYSNTIGANVANGGMVPLKKDANGDPTTLLDSDSEVFTPSVADEINTSIQSALVNTLPPYATLPC